LTTDTVDDAGLPGCGTDGTDVETVGSVDDAGNVVNVRICAPSERMNA